MRTLVVIACAALVGCCATQPKPVPVMATTAACVVPARPVYKSITFKECAGWTACLDAENAQNLERRIQAAEAWIIEVSLRCGDAK